MNTKNEPRVQRDLPEPTTQVGVADDVELDVWVMGAGEPVVLVHGAMTRDLLVPLAHELTGKGGYRVIHYGRRGHGGHGLPAEVADMAGQARDVVAILDALGVERAHVAGHSIGAYIALELAAQAPERVLSAILCEPLLLQQLSEPTQQELQSSQQVLSQIAETYMSGQADRAVTAFCDFTAGVEGAMAVIEPLLPRGARELAAADLDTFFRIDGPAMSSYRADPTTVEAISAPIQWVSGAESPPFFFESREVLRELLPRTTAVVVAGAGHYFPILRAAGTATAVDDWVRSQAPAGRTTAVPQRYRSSVRASAAPAAGA